MLLKHTTFKVYVTHLPVIKGIFVFDYYLFDGLYYRFFSKKSSENVK